jgi:dipeptidase E
MLRLLLVSNSTMHGRGYLDHCADAIRSRFGAARRVLFAPFALQDRAGYAAKARARFAELGYALDGLHESVGAPGGPRAAVERADALFVGGGNTFRLLAALYEHDLLAPIRARAAAGMPYLGSSAGTNVACASIKTTNDMPIVGTPSLEALGLVPFNVNPHYLDADPRSTHMGETREQRIREFHEENENPVVGLREGAWIRVDGERAVLEGTTGARLFRRGQAPVELATGADLGALLRRADWAAPVG